MKAQTKQSKGGGQLSRGKGAVVCKNARSNQDERFDLPTVGANTLDIMSVAGCNALAIRSKETIVVNPHEFIKHADKLKIHFISYEKDFNWKEHRKLQGNS